MIDEKRLKAHLENGEVERVMCASNYYDDGKDHMYQPYNIDKGFVICGLRHANCGMSYLAANKEATKWDNCIQGFLTSKNRFLNRADSLELVTSTGQLTKPIQGGMLTSEDLW